MGFIFVVVVAVVCIAFLTIICIISLLQVNHGKIITSNSVNFIASTIIHEFRKVVDLCGIGLIDNEGATGNACVSEMHIKVMRKNHVEH